MKITALLVLTWALWYIVMVVPRLIIFGVLILQWKQQMSQKVINGFAPVAPFARFTFFCSIFSVSCLPPIFDYQNPPPKPPPSFMSPLIVQAQTNASIPREYQMPDDIRNFFKDGKPRPALIAMLSH